jgi:hypothetical protein
VPAVNKPEKDKSYLSGQDTRLLLVMCAEFIALCAKFARDMDPMSSAMLSYVGEEIVSETAMLSYAGEEIGITQIQLH